MYILNGNFITFLPFALLGDKNIPVFIDSQAAAKAEPKDQEDDIES